ncbi:glyoxylase-like metal-dependent hydrolase (beta-lactamase superfamily II) [Pontibacter ummariensis]|uniref:Glyoxylase, beta-lactamase superfamily II n=1 Tax=Pontibacter ummariensis TaxID=1610492 RepID=A0A239J6S8_9BACT|nr:MBL fold metallo-hydrolase [Pontibacter ummariensis]PRY08906.1 glyoxylase-like metal-dependent hydrolase (beta-lactamase superfamily II) [Pontibacter ummariensis]SNT01479.1 Glyoxylase, beta-lactamase superfamily II [Pontibacter ummariensis]
MGNTLGSNRQNFSVAPLVWGLKTVFVNLYFVAEPDGSWVLIDTGVAGSASKIKEMAEGLFGENNRPKAILLTHGHFDHIGSVKELAEEWEVPVFAHPLELPYLTGQSNYPPPDSSVGGGAMAYMAFMYPKKPINIRDHVELLPPDGTVPGLPHWRWLHTPGHSPGHVSFFRGEDRTLIAGDAFVTRDGESAIAVMTEKREVHGPPAYFTPDWGAAHHSIDELANLSPEIAATGHGLPMKGEELRRQLDDLVKDFWLKEVPKSGRYVHEPAVTDEQGVVSVPPPVSNPVPTVLAVAGAVALAGLAWAAFSKRNDNTYQRNRYIRQQMEPPLNRPYSHNRVMAGMPPTVDPEHDDPHDNTNNYP